MRRRLPILLLLAAWAAACHDPDRRLKEQVEREPIPAELRELAGDPTRLERHVYARGYGLPSPKAVDAAHAETTAREAAEENARANLIERVRGLALRSDLLVRSLIERDGLAPVEAELAARIEILRTELGPDGIHRSLARVELKRFLETLAARSAAPGRLVASYDPAAFENYPAVADRPDWKSLAKAVQTAIGDGKPAIAGPPPRWRVPAGAPAGELWPGALGVPWFLGPLGPLRLPAPKKKEEKKNPPAPASELWPGALGVPWFLGPLGPRRLPAPKKKEEKKNPPAPAGVVQLAPWPPPGLRWSRSPSPRQATRYAVVATTPRIERAPDKQQEPKKQKGPIQPLDQGAQHVVRMVVLLPLPLAAGRTLREALPGGSFPTGTVWTNAPAGSAARAMLEGRNLRVIADGATCVAYELRSKERLSADQVGGKVLEPGGATLSLVGAAEGAPPEPPPLDRASPRFLIASPPSNQLLAAGIAEVIVSGTIVDRAGITDLRAGRTLEQMLRPGGKLRAPRVLPFQLAFPLVKGKNELILAARDALGNWGAVRIAVYRD